MPPIAAIFFEVSQCSIFDFICQSFDAISSGEGIDGLGHARFVSENLLRAQRNASGQFRWQRQRFVITIGMQRLRSPQYGSHCLHRGTNDVVLRLLRGQGGTGGLRMKSQHPRARIFGGKFFPHDAGPHAPRGAELRNFFKKIAVRVEEKRQPRRKQVNIETCINSGLHVGLAIGQGKRHFLHGG